jgi:riboflavin kinase/FMN adenylyltransferase
MPKKGSVVTIGVYDGLHLGHMQVLSKVTALAEKEGLKSVVVTFDRHPASVVRPDSAPLQLTDLPQRIELLTEAGIDTVKVIEFTKTRAAESAEDFVDEVLVGELGAKVVVVGRDFHFGRERGGNVALLEKMGAERDFRVEPFDLVSDSSGDVVSSTRIRRAVEEGDLEEAARLLGRRYEVRGSALGPVEGFAGAGEGSSGTSLAVPTEILLPPPGGYEAEVGKPGPGLLTSSCHVLVPPDRAALAVLGLSEPPGVGEVMRVVFTRPARLAGS